MLFLSGHVVATLIRTTNFTNHHHNYNYHHHNNNHNSVNMESGDDALMPPPLDPNTSGERRKKRKRKREKANPAPLGEKATKALHTMEEKAAQAPHPSLQGPSTSEEPKKKKKKKRSRNSSSPPPVSHTAEPAKKKKKSKGKKAKRRRAKELRLRESPREEEEEQEQGPANHESESNSGRAHQLQGPSHVIDPTSDDDYGLGAIRSAYDADGNLVDAAEEEAEKDGDPDYTVPAGSDHAEESADSNPEEEEEEPRGDRGSVSEGSGMEGEGEQSSNDDDDDNEETGRLSRKAKAKATTTRPRHQPFQIAGSAVEYSCYLCDHKCLHRKDSMVKHIIKSHSVAKDDPRLAEWKQENKGGRSQLCPHCRKAFSNLGQHLAQAPLRCPVLKKRAALRAKRLEKIRARQQVAAARRKGEDAHQLELAGDVRTIPDVIAHYKAYLVCQGYSALTVGNYCRRLDAFLSWAEEQPASFQAAGLFPDRYGERPMLLPSTLIEDYAIFKQAESASTAKQAMQAVEVFIKVAKAHLARQQMRTETNIYNSVLVNFDACSTLAKEQRKRLEVVERQQYSLNREEKKREEALETRPGDVLQLMRDFLQSAYLSRYCEDINNNIFLKLQAEDIAPTTVRDACLGLLLLTSGGHRGVEMRKLTVKEWTDGTDEDGQFKVLVHHHKTAKSHGAAPIIISRPFIRTLVNTYLEFCRPSLAASLEEGDVSQSTHPLFVTQRGKGMALDRPAIEWIQEHMKKADLNDPKGKLQTLNTSAIRKCWSTIGQTSSDPTVREQMPQFQMHSRQVAQSHYDQSGPATARRIAGLVDDTLFGTEGTPPLQPESAPPPQPTAEEQEKDWAEFNASVGTSQGGGKKGRPFSQQQLSLLERIFPLDDGLRVIDVSRCLSVTDPEFKDFWKALVAVYKTPRAACQRIRVTLKRRANK